MSTFKIKTMKNIVTKLIENLQEKKRQTLMVSDTIIDIQKRERTTQHNQIHRCSNVSMQTSTPKQNTSGKQKNLLILYPAHNHK